MDRALVEGDDVRCGSVCSDRCSCRVLAKSSRCQPAGTAPYWRRSLLRPLMRYRPSPWPPRSGMGVRLGRGGAHCAPTSAGCTTPWVRTRALLREMLFKEAAVTVPPQFNPNAKINPVDKVLSPAVAAKIDSFD